MSQAALQLLQGEDTDEATPATPSQQAIALLEGRTKPAPVRKPDNLDLALNEEGLRRSLRNPVSDAIGDTLMNIATGTGAQAVAGLRGLYAYATGAEKPREAVDETTDALTYHGESEMAPWSPLAWPGMLIKAGAEKTYELTDSPLAATAVDVGANAALLAAGARGVRAAPRGEIPPAVSPATPLSDVPVSRVQPPVEEIIGQALSKQSMGAAAAVPSRLMTASPELQAAIRAEARSGGVNPEALDRHLEADSLPVRIQLTKGQATQDPVLISDEMNRRGKDPEFASRFNEQNQQLIDNLDEIRRESSPNVVGNDPIQNGQQIVDSYKTIDQASRDEIGAAYQAARDANGGELPMDAQAFTKAADAALKKNMKARYVPSEIAADLAEIRETGAMNFETFENLRTNLAAEGRKAERSGDGNAAAAINLIRDAIENVEPLGKAKEVKPLFDKARSLAKARFDRLRADPAYKAASEDASEVGQVSPLADQFVEKYIVKGKAAHLDRMRENLANDAAANEVISAAALNYLKAKSGVNLYTNEGNFSQAGFNRALAEITPKMDRLLSPQAAEQVQTLGNVARYVQAQPRGSFVNNSNTTVAAHAANLAKGVAERSVNAMIPGADLGTLGREKLAKRADKKEVQEALKPGAGIGMKPKKGQP
jgi:hypothetical protein